MITDVSQSARRYIGRKGGDLFVWFTDMSSSDISFQHVSTTRPAHINLIPHRDHEVTIWLDARLKAEELHVRRRPWPLGPIEVNGTGAGYTPVNAAGAH